MLSDDLAKHFLKRGQQKKVEETAEGAAYRTEDLAKFVCYPGLDQSDDEDLDPASQSFDIQVFPEIGSHRYRTNTAQKLEKMNQARRKAARIRSVKVDDSTVSEATDTDIFERKEVKQTQAPDDVSKKPPISRLSEQLTMCPKQSQNKFLQYARFDGTSQTGIATKNLSIFLTMLPENLRNFPMKVCVAANATIEEVIGYICYKCSIQYPDIQLQSARNYGLYLTEEDGEIDMDLPPLDLREPCAKFGFTHLALTVRKPIAQVVIDYRSLSMTSEMESASEAAVAAIRSISNSHSDGDMARMLGHNSKIEAPLYKTYNLNLIHGPFKTKVQLGISGERIEIDPVRVQNSRFFKFRPVNFNIESVAYCEVVEKHPMKAQIRLWYVVNPQSKNFTDVMPNTSQNYLSSNTSSASPLHLNLAPAADNFKSYVFETDAVTANEINSKINFLLEVRSSAIRREFLFIKEKKRERPLTKKVFGK